MYWGEKNVIAAGGGTAGIGKSTFVANLGISMAARGKNVVVIDADTGTPNLHAILGVQSPEKTLDDFLTNRQADLSRTLTDTAYSNVRLLSSASGALSLASPNYTERQRLFRAIQKLKADVIIFDIAAGTHQRATDFFSLAPIGIILVEPAPESLENTFSFIKNLLVRGLLRRFYHDKEITAFIRNSTDPRDTQHALHFSDLLAKLEEKAPAKVSAYRQLFLEGVCRMSLVVNSVKNSDQNAAGDNFARLIKQEFSLTMEILGSLPFEAAMKDAVTKRIPFVIKNPESPYAKKMLDIVSKIDILKSTRSPE
jgi:flagellar biosynthesis protein FlhG